MAVGPIADELVAKIAERAATIKTGDGTGDADMGPLVTRAHRDKVAAYVDAGEAAGATVVVDGRTVTPDGGPDGFWLGPTLLDHVTPAMSVYTDEIFGPVLSVLRVDTYDEALELINTNPYGNGTAIFTNDGGAARRFQNEVEVGMVGINVPIPVPMAYYSFGGWKNSLFGDSHAHGTEGVHFFTRGKAITSRWLDPSHGGLDSASPLKQIDTEASPGECSHRRSTSECSSVSGYRQGGASSPTPLLDLVNRCLGSARNLRQAKSMQEAIHNDHGIVEKSPRIRPEVV